MQLLEASQLRAESLQTFQPPLRIKQGENENDAIRNRMSDFDKRRIPHPKTQ